MGTPGELLTLRFRAPSNGFSHPAECAICYEAFQELEEAKALPCTSDSACPSFYHVSCIEKWLEKDASCPLCRRSFPHLSLAGDSDSEVPLAFGPGAPLFDPPPISNPLRMESRERVVSAREFAQRYHTHTHGPLWRQQAAQTSQASSSNARAMVRTPIEYSPQQAAISVDELAQRGYDRLSRRQQTAQITQVARSHACARGGTDGASLQAHVAHGHLEHVHVQQSSQASRLAHARMSPSSRQDTSQMVWSPGEDPEWLRQVGGRTPPISSECLPHDTQHSPSDGPSSSPDTSAWRQPRRRGEQPASSTDTSALRLPRQRGEQPASTDTSALRQPGRGGDDHPAFSTDPNMWRQPRRRA